MPDILKNALFSQCVNVCVTCIVFTLNLELCYFGKDGHVFECPASFVIKTSHSN
jgi:hypothetical protein